MFTPHVANVLGFFVDVQSKKSKTSRPYRFLATTTPLFTFVVCSPLATAATSPNKT